MLFVVTIIFLVFFQYLLNSKGTSSLTPSLLLGYLKMSPSVVSRVDWSEDDAL